MEYFKAFIRVVKSINHDSGSYFGWEDIVREPLIAAKNKTEVKQILLEKYPQFFQNGKVYEKETKDTAQFFYVVIFPLYNHEIDLIYDGQWICDSCGQAHANKYEHRPYKSERLFPGKFFCESECYDNYKKEIYKDIELPDNTNYIRPNSPNFIYKITEKSTGKSYIGKTRNEPFFRWWDHLKRSSTPFGIYLQSTKLSDWTFEVIDILPPETKDTDVFMAESRYIVEHNCILNGFNTLISNKSAIPSNQLDLLTQTHPERRGE